jgi:hypothetical protein
MAENELGGRVSKLEQDVSALKVDTAKIATSLDALKETAAERHDYLKESLAEIKEAVRSDDDDAAHSRWLRQVLTPQTVTIILAILASAVGAPMVAQSLLASPAPTVQVAPSSEVKDGASDAEPKSEEKEEEEETSPQ